MGSAADDEDALSDLEDDAAPVVLPAPSPVSNADSFKSLLAELESERQARKAAENAKVELQSKLTRLKTYAQEAGKLKDEAIRHKEEAQKSKEELAKQLNEALLQRDDAIRQRDTVAQQRDEALKSKEDLSKQKDDASKARESSRSEIEAAARLLVAGADKITGKASSIKSFPANLPRSSSYTGVAAIAYGYSKRAEDIVDELVRLQDIAVKDRSEMRQQMEQRNYQIAIEVSELEASIRSLKDEVAQKSLELEKWQKLTADKEGRMSEIEQKMSHKLAEAEKETEMLKKAAQVAEEKREKLKAAISELSHMAFKADGILANLANSVSNSQKHPDNRSALSSSTRGEPEERLQNCISRIKELFELCLKLEMTWKEHRELTKKKVDDLEGTITRLVTEKKEITDCLRSALANKQEVVGAVSKVDSNHNSSTATKSREATITDFSLSDEFIKGEAISMASALQDEIKSLRQEIFELQQLLATARGEVEWLRVTSERQTKEVYEKTAQIQELEEKQSFIQEKVEGLSMELVAADEEVLRWKQAATKEAEAGATVLEEVERCQEEIAILKERIEQLSQSLEESNSKLRSKEEMATAAIAARNAAERSLRIADERAVELRERIEEMTRQFEILEGRGEGGLTMGLLNMCWPYQWFRGGALPYLQRDTEAQPGAEMDELLEPLM